MSICRSIYLSIDRSFSLSSHQSFDLSLDVRMDVAKHRSVYVSIDLVTGLSIDLAIKSHGIYSQLCFKNRCLPEGPLRYFPSSADGCMIGFGDKTDAKPRRDTDGLEETSSRQRSNENTGNNMVICCRLESATRKDTHTHAGLQPMLKCWLAIVRSEKTHTLTCNEFRLVM